MSSSTQNMSPSMRRINFALLSGWVILTLGIAWYCWLYAGQDFRGYYAAAKVFLAGKNPYNYQIVSKILIDVTGHMGNNPYYYPPWFAIFISPFALLPYNTARLVWLLVNALLWMGGLVIAWPHFSQEDIKWKKYVAWIVGTITFLWFTLRYEQVGALLFFITALTLHCYLTERKLLAGVLLAFLLIKPSITALVVLGVLVFSLRNKNRMVLIGFLSTLSLLLLISTILIPEWYLSLTKPDFGKGLWSVMDGPEIVVATRINTTLMDWMGSFGLSKSIINIVYAVIVVLGLLILGRLWISINQYLVMLCVTILVSFWVTPYALQYDFPPLMLVAIFIIGKMYLLPNKFQLFLSLIFAAMITVIFWERPISDGFWIVIGLSLAFSVVKYFAPTTGLVVDFTK